MFENVDGRTDDGRTTDGRTTDAGVTGILIAHLGAFGSGELKRKRLEKPSRHTPRWLPEPFLGAFLERFPQLYKAHLFALSAFLEP